MCGRYYVNDETGKEIERIVEQINVKIKMNRESRDHYSIDIHPTDYAVIITEQESRLVAAEKKWGFPGFGKQKIIFNARAESVLEKKTFRNSIIKRRIIVPAAGFYEWDHKKEKATFRSKSGSTLFLAGFYKHLDNEDRFVILTTAANTSVQDTHSRMPLLLERDELNDWIFSESAYSSILKKIPEELEKQLDYEQQSFFN